MRILATGATGFVGRWLRAELEDAGHEVTGMPGSQALDITDAEAVATSLLRVEPDAVVHLAAVSYAGDARSDPVHALRVNVGGTVAVMEAARCLPRRPLVLVPSSAEVYGIPRQEDLPLRETAPVRPAAPYGFTKLAQEGAAFEMAVRYGIPLVITRSFNHIGPGQRPDFVVPALARRIAAAVAGRADSIPVGNADVKRDFLDVRDVAVAYRLLLEFAASAPGETPRIVNVASEQAVSIRWVAETMREAVGCTAPLEVQEDLVRPDDPPEIVGSSEVLSALTGWRPTHNLADTLREIVREAVTQPSMR